MKAGTTFLVDPDTTNDESVPVTIYEGSWSIQTVVLCGHTKSYCTTDLMLTVPLTRGHLSIPQWECHMSAVGVILGMERCK